MSPPSSFADCYKENNTALPGNDVNNGVNNRQDDEEACRLSCRTVAGSVFFDWVSPDYHDSNFHNTCWCKHSDSGRQDSVGAISGNVNCVGKLEYYSGVTAATTPISIGKSVPPLSGSPLCTLAMGKCLDHKIIQYLRNLSVFPRVCYFKAW